MQLYTKKTCPYCIYAKALLEQYKIPHKESMIDNSTHKIMSKKTGQNTVPYIFLDKRVLLGGYSDLQEWVQLKSPLKYYSMQHLFHIIVYTISNASTKKKQKYKSELYNLFKAT